MNLSDSARLLLRQMLQKPLYVVVRVPNDMSRFDELIEDHLKWAIAAEGRGELFASGPFFDERGEPGTSGGMSILRATSIEEVQTILSDDPFIQEKVYTASIRKWLLMEGGITVNLRFADRSYTLE
ncbi:YciI family protein [Paraburkholderia hospita]|uniref:YCII-related domain-containing protein n=1 Tax=Paraburkholderia hospita TaxID=169430 RepID=A0AAJ4T1R8_9BURK|nr:YciI family protein [Paraburkholderia hospita]AUT76265.1 hypothetical protein C2L64_49265 [Paraburkholderia hospita]AXF05637.1 hypothetical protein CUJ88_45025 [Paraburkholderia hospita]SEI17782.1 hypothetical protein SAMN05192544_103037 [Paraburkholderia hospita]